VKKYFCWPITPQGLRWQRGRSGSGALRRMPKERHAGEKE
jgi:hypothetical protein